MRTHRRQDRLRPTKQVAYGLDFVSGQIQTEARPMSIEAVKRFLDSDQPHFAKLIGIQIVSYSADKVEAEFKIGQEHSNRGGAMHGGAIMTLADTIGGLATTASLPDGHGTVTLESKTNFLAAIPVGDTARATCTPLHRGRTTMVWETRVVRGDGKLAAIVTQTQLVIPPGRDHQSNNK
jgi:1,4-dihydroxy-2-naphthoyl-CoA hydrolase